MVPVQTDRWHFSDLVRLHLLLVEVLKKADVNGGAVKGNLLELLHRSAAPSKTRWSNCDEYDAFKAALSIAC